MTKYDKFLPEITGISDKQIAYAQSLRDSYITRRAAGIQTAIAFKRGTITEEAMKVGAERAHVSFEEYSPWLEKYIARELKIIAMSNASEIIDELKAR